MLFRRRRQTCHVKTSLRLAGRWSLAGNGLRCGLLCAIYKWLQLKYFPGWPLQPHSDCKVAAVWPLRPYAVHQNNKTLCSPSAPVNKESLAEGATTILTEGVVDAIKKLVETGRWRFKVTLHPKMDEVTMA